MCKKQVLLYKGIYDWDALVTDRISATVEVFEPHWNIKGILGTWVHF